MRYRYLFLLFLLFPAVLPAQNLSFAESERDLDAYRVDPLSSRLLQSNNPCEDSLYVELSNMPVGQMSEEEYELFQEMDEACEEYREAAAEPAEQEDEETTIEEEPRLFNSILVITGVAGIISAVYFLTR